MPENPAPPTDLEQRMAALEAREAEIRRRILNIEAAFDRIRDACQSIVNTLAEILP